MFQNVSIWLPPAENPEFIGLENAERVFLNNEVRSISHTKNLSKILPATITEPKLKINSTFFKEYHLFSDILW